MMIHAGWLVFAFVAGMGLTICAAWLAAFMNEKNDEAFDAGLERIMDLSLMWRRRAEIAEAKLSVLEPKKEAVK